MKINVIIIIILFILLQGCINKAPNENLTSKNTSTKELAEKIAKLSTIELESVDSYDKFKDLADNFNDLIRLLNKEGDYNIREFEVTEESYQKISRVLTEYGPLINNYNEVVTSAKEYDGTTEKEKIFYVAIGTFGLETALIVTTAFAIPVYEGVGIAYRAIGLNKFAFSCPTCIEIILGQAHWFVRTYMVEKSSETAEQILKLLESGGIKDLKQKTQDSINDTLNWTRSVSYSWDTNLSTGVNPKTWNS